MNESQQQLTMVVTGDPIIVFFIGFLADHVFYDHQTSAKKHESTYKP